MLRGAIWGLLLLSVAISAQTWLEWSEWNGDCKTNPKLLAQTRFRVCQRVDHQEGTAAPCFGDTIDIIPCQKCPAQGTWGEWTAMDGCSDSCGAFGRKFRTRECKKPVFCPNVPCQGEAREVEKSGEPCDNQSPCIIPKRACHVDYRMSIDENENRNICVKKVQA